MPRSPNTASLDRPDFFAWLEKNWREIFAGGPARDRGDRRILPRQGRRRRRDEYETGDRALLDLGHTSATRWRPRPGYDERLVHGEGVAIGMALAHRFSSRLNLCSMDDALRVEWRI